MYRCKIMVPITLCRFLGPPCAYQKLDHVKFNHYTEELKRQIFGQANFGGRGR